LARFDSTDLDFTPGDDGFDDVGESSVGDQR
jgi:hypothetical protein